ncbi:5-(carboxyamino)imidazole ribonucleotide synthase [Halopelagius longus]|uniref:N5-carboxyaminoimidazole ribonucleotide synthase n=1 Tax=Halopelagius longus TaxID=1236180 RepID=A0A1H1BR57_9EURY|nr:5-(carboxyamino)imidazole ribonucleotide synthase [Halopelagius longus]RDI70889.1 5-(carboxyamino)imidazole ribonucleotide synthase [Halopelagius longus]SDQ54465.1 5-(carboxyamino)imidazole ribonucleotide synthase [Halopelagius longus]
MTVTVPGPTLGVVGGGQLGRMLAEAAAPLGVDVVVLDPTPDCPAAPVAREQIVGGFDDPEAFRELASRVDALTFEIELADSDLLAEVSEEFGLTVHPSPETLRTIEDKLVQKRALQEAGVPVPPFRRVDDEADLREALDEFGSVMLKARTGGYDGRGNVPVRDESEAEAALERLGGPAMAEAFVDFERELSVIAVQGDGEVRTFPAGENVHEEEILRETLVPARTTEGVRERADEVARNVLSMLSGRGVFGIELFETGEGEILVNEIAPRPHNSGHWSIEGARTSQFEQHVRAVLGWPLGSTALRSPTVSANVLGTVEETRAARLGNVESVLSAEAASLHWYGKDDVRPLRKMGHLTLTGEADADVTDLLSRARDLRDGLTFE